MFSQYSGPRGSGNIIQSPERALQFFSDFLGIYPTLMEPTFELRQILEVLRKSLRVA